MDTRYKDRGYSAEFFETEYGAYLTLFKRGEEVAQISIGLFENKGPQAPVVIDIWQGRKRLALPVKSTVGDVR